MSNPIETEQLTGAEALRVQAADWLMQQRTSDSWGPEDQQALDSWLAESPAHLLAYWRLDAAWTRTDRLAALRESMRNAQMVPDRKGPFPFVMRAVAVALVVVSMGAAFLWRSTQPNDQEYATSVGGHETIRLADGSLIELNTDSAVRVLDQNSRRTVWLDKGEAYFQIVHDPVRPFDVLIGDRKVSDVGTKFLVRQLAGGIKVAVLEGRVLFGPSQQIPAVHDIPLSGGEVLVTSASATSITRTSPTSIANELGWRRGFLVFYREPLADAVQEFNRYNREKIAVVGHDAAKLSVTGTLSATDPDQFIRMARNVFGLHVERTNGQILISR